MSGGVEEERMSGGVEEEGSGGGEEALTCVSLPKMCGKDDGKDGAACTAGKACLPMLTGSSGLSVKPKMPLTWLYVTACVGPRERVVG